jgi:hypothetical protein
MRSGFLTLLLVFASSSAAAAGRRIERCNAYLLSPVDLQSSTRVALTVKPTKLQLAAAEDRLENYMKSAPLESAEVLKYLLALRQDTPPAYRASHAGFIGALTNLYLMRPGNEDFTNERIETFLENFWEDFLVYRRETEGQARLEREVQFLERMNALFPSSLQSAWRIEMPDYFKEILSYKEINRNFSDHSGQRLEYQRLIAAELSVAGPNWDVTQMMKLKVIRNPSFRGNEDFELDSKLWKGGGIFEGESPTQALVFLTRLSHRLNLRTPEQQNFDAHVDRIRRLVADSGPRPPRF